MTRYLYLVCLSLLFQVTYLSKRQHFGHNTEERFFGAEYTSCAYGVYQAPIHIEARHVQPVEMPALDFAGYGNYLAAPLTLTNNGHTVKLTPGIYPPEGFYPRPRVSGALLTSEYELENVHFHWGTDNDRGSEHVLNGVRYPMEMHIVHRNVKYESLREAVGHRDGLVVLGFLFQLQVKDNPRYRHLVKPLRRLMENNSSATLEASFALSTILPRRTDHFFTYEGSLTSPPCNEAVTWFVFPDPILISLEQMDLYRKLPIHENFRPVQPIGQRKVFFRQQDRFKKGAPMEYTRQAVGSRLFWLRV